MSTAPKRQRYGAATTNSAQISALIGDDPGDQIGALEPIRVDQIDFDPENVRKLGLDPADPRNIDPNDPNADQKRERLERLEELASSISLHGLKEPISIYRVGARFRVAWGERRLTAHRMLGLAHIHARILPKRPADAIASQLAENMFREGLTLAERVHAFDRLIAESSLGPNPIKVAADLSAATGVSLPQATRYFGLHHATPDVRAAIDAGVLTSLKRAYAVSTVADPGERAAMIAGDQSAPSMPSPAVGPQQQVAKAPPRRPKSRPRLHLTVKLSGTGAGAVVRKIAEAVLDKKTFQGFSTVAWDDLTAVQSVLEQVIRRLQRDLDPKSAAGETAP